MIERIKQVIEYSQLSSSAFADTIGISRSGLTHLLTGRNQPSLDVARKILAKFPDVSTEWLIMGMGDMLRPDEQADTISGAVQSGASSNAYPAENLKSDPQTNLFGEFENPTKPESDMAEDVEIVAEKENAVVEQETKDPEETFEPVTVSSPIVADTPSEVTTPAQPSVRKSTEYRQTTPVKRDRRQPNNIPERKLQKIVFFYDDHSFEVYNNI